MKKFRAIGIVVLVIMMFIGLVGYRISEKKKKEAELKETKPPLTSVSVVKAKKGKLSETFSTTGTVISQTEVQIVPKVTGRLLQLNIEEGTRVQAGQVIGQIEHTEIDAQIAQAKAQAAIARANLELLKNGPLQTQIDQASASVSQAIASEKQAESNLAQIKVNYQHTESEYKRYQNLANQGAIPGQQLDTYRTQLDTSRKQVDAAQQQVAASKQQVVSAKAALKALKDGNRPEQISGGVGQIEQANASIKLLEAQFANYQITSPITGVITKKNVEIGSLVSMNSPIATVSKSETPDLEMNIPEKQILKVRLGQNVNIESSAFPDQTITVKIREISPVVDLQTRLVKVKAAIISKLPLKIGMSFDCRIVLNENSNSLILPAEAILQVENKKVVYLAVNNKVQQKDVKLGLQTPDEVQVVSGISPSDNVITKGNTFVKPGDSIQIQPYVNVGEGE